MRMLYTSLITSIINTPSSSQYAEHGFLRGKKKITSATATASNEDAEDKSSNRRTLMDLIIETINKCSEDFDEGVQVQVVDQSLSGNLTDYSAQIGHALISSFFLITGYKGFANSCNFIAL
jgi:hypothetical protein